MKKKKTGGKKHTVHLHAPIPCEPARSKMEAHGLTHTACAQTPGRAQDETGQSVDPQNAGVPLSDGTSPRTVRNSVFLYTSRVSRGGCGATWSAHRKRRDVDRAFLSIVVSKSVGAFLHFLSSVRCSPQRVRTWALEKAKNRGGKKHTVHLHAPIPCEPARSKMEAHGLTHTACAQTPGRAQDETGQSVDPQNAGVPLSDGTSPRTVRNSVFLYTRGLLEGGAGRLGVHTANGGTSTERSCRSSFQRA